MGLGLGEQPEPPGTFWYPFLADAVPGKYRLSQEVHLTVSEEGQDAGGTSFRAASGEVEFEIKLADSKKGDAAPAEKPADDSAEKPASKPLTIRGKVVDSATGKPVAPFITQSGKFDPADPKKVSWGYSEGRSSSRDGSFSTTVRWTEGWTARILADGYIPQPVITSAPPDDVDEMEVVIRLRRGPKVRGVVLDHIGKPVKDAAVFALGPTG